MKTNKYLNITLFCLLYLFLSIEIKGQSLDSLMSQLIANNSELKVLENEYLAAMERSPQVGQLPQPEAGIGAFLLPVETRLGAQRVRLSATQMFPWFGSLGSKKELETAKARALYERIEARLLDLIYDLKNAYYQLYEIQKSKSIVQRNIFVLESLERFALSKVESGKASTADVLRVQLKIEELEQELEILKTSETNPRSSINQLLNRSMDVPVNVQDSLGFAEIPYDKSLFTSTIQQNHPMVRMFDLQQEVSRQSMAVNAMDAKPSFGVGLDYILVDGRSDAIPDKNGRDILQLRGTVKVPIYRDKYKAKDREEELKITALDYKKEAILDQYLFTIEKAYTMHETARLRMELYDQQIVLTQSAINILESAYSSSGDYFDELLRLEKELIDYDLKKLKAIVKSHIARSSLERFIGR